MTHYRGTDETENELVEKANFTGGTFGSPFPDLDTALGFMRSSIAEFRFSNC